MSPEWEDSAEAAMCVECGRHTYNLEYIEPPTCKDCVRAAEIADEDGDEDGECD